MSGHDFPWLDEVEFWLTPAQFFCDHKPQLVSLLFQVSLGGRKFSVAVPSCEPVEPLDLNLSVTQRSREPHDPFESAPGFFDWRGGQTAQHLKMREEASGGNTKVVDVFFRRMLTAVSKRARMFVATVLPRADEACTLIFRGVPPAFRAVGE